MSLSDDIRKAYAGADPTVARVRIAILKIHGAAVAADSRLAQVQRIVTESIDNPPFTVWSTLLHDSAKDCAAHFRALATELEAGVATLSTARREWDKFEAAPLLPAPKPDSNTALAKGTDDAVRPGDAREPEPQTGDQVPF